MPYEATAEFCPIFCFFGGNGVSRKYAFEIHWPLDRELILADILELKWDTDTFWAKLGHSCHFVAFCGLRKGLAQCYCDHRGSLLPICLSFIVYSLTPWVLLSIDTVCIRSQIFFEKKTYLTKNFPLRKWNSRVKILTSPPLIKLFGKHLPHKK